MYPNLKLELWRQGIRQNRLAKLLGMDEALLSRLVNGFRNPDPETRARIAELLHSNEQWLFDSIDNIPRSVVPGQNDPIASTVNKKTINSRNV
jgi:transcriptional regulator with XRE-family HTH domain